MKSLQLPFLAICLLASTFLTAQVTNNFQLPTSVNTDGAAPDASAILDVQATDKGMLAPRMTTAQRTAIASPATGLLVYDTDHIPPKQEFVTEILAWLDQRFGPVKRL